MITEFRRLNAEMSMTQLELEGMEPPKRPMTEDDWMAKWMELSDLFSPTTPVEELALFAGRIDQVKRLVEAVFQRGQHVLVHGDRGVGKTSLVNTCQARIFAHSKWAKFFVVRCVKGDTYAQIWSRLFEGFKFSDEDHPSDHWHGEPDPNSILKIAQRFKASERPIFMFDEFDRISDLDTKLKMAETIKMLSDAAPAATIVCVGVGSTIAELMAEHESAGRALKDIYMQRMSPDEIFEIVVKRLTRLGMTIDEAALKRIATLSRGMPGYAHLIGMYSGKAAVQRESLNVAIEDVAASLPTCIEEAYEKTRLAYRKAIDSTMPSSQHSEVLLACALAEQDEIGRFVSSAVREPISKIFGEPRTIASFTRHLGAFCLEQRGRVLEKEGSGKNIRFRFSDPMMQSYVIMRALFEKRIDYDWPEVQANLA